MSEPQLKSFQLFTEISSDYFFNIRIDSKHNFTFEYVSDYLQKISALSFPDTDFTTRFFNFFDLHQLISTVVETQQSQTVERCISLSDNEKVWFEIFVKPITNSDGNNVSFVVGKFNNISKSKVAEEKIDQQKIYFQSIIDSLIVPFYVIDPVDYTIIHSNKALGEIAVGTKCYQATHLRNTPCNDNEHHCPVTEIMETKHEITTFHTHYNANGEKINVEVHSQPIFDSNNNIFRIAEYCVDVTTYFKTKELLQFSEEKFNKAFYNSPDLILITRASDGKIVDVNANFNKLSGYTRNETIGKSTLMLDIWIDNEERIQFLKTLFKKREVLEMEVLLRIKNGDTRNALISGNFIKIKTELYILIVIKDITKRKKIEQELILAKEKAEESDKLKSAFLANMSHEIRTPMNGIIGFSDMLVKPNVTKEKQLQFVEIIQECGHQLLTLIDDLIDIAKIETNQIIITNREICLNDLLSDVYAIFKIKTDASGLELTMHSGLVDDDCYINTDPIRLKQVLINLLNNAIKFTPKGHVKFGYTIKNNSEPSEIEFYIEDSGIGIQQKDFDIIFERFRQADIGISRKFGGSGLGLAISKSLVRIMGGEIRLESVVNRGTVFYFTIPFYTKKNVVHVKSTNAEKSVMTISKPICMLIAEDEDINYAFLEEAFSEMNVTLLRACNGFEAVVLVKNHPEIEIVLMDMKMGVMDGFEATRQIKQFRNNLPIIAQTAYTHEAEKERVIQCGCDDYISKPMDINKLIGLIQKHA